jgi:large subunit ribosomal protein L24
MARHVKTGDTVMVISGAEKGKTGKVLRIISPKVAKGTTARFTSGKVVIEGLNRVWKHVKKDQRHPNGGRIQKEASISISKVQPIDPSTGKATRVKFKTEGTSKTRVAKSGNVLSTLTK